MVKIGIALSGGGVKGAAHIGVIQALTENHIDFSIISGTSSGSIVAALYSMGYTPDEILKLFNYFSKIVVRNSPMYTHPDGKRGLSINAGGVLSGENISFAISESAKYKKIESMNQLNKQILIPAVDVDNSTKYVFTNCELEGEKYIKNAPIDTAVRASSSYPGVFAPTIYKGHKFIDGGILDNIPVDEAKSAGAEFIIAVKFALNKNSKERGVAKITAKALDIMFENTSKNEIKHANYVININTKDASIFDIKRIKDCYQYGYDQTIAQIDKIKEQIALCNNAN